MRPNITFPRISLIPTRCFRSGNSTPNTGYSTDGENNTLVSEELNTVQLGGFYFQDPQPLSDFALRYFRIDLDANTPFPGYNNSSLPLYNGGTANIKWPGPHMVCIVEATVVAQFYGESSNDGYFARPVASFKHTLVRDSVNPDTFETFYQDFEVTNISPNASSQQYDENSIINLNSANNYIEYNSTFNTFDFHIDPASGGSSGGRLLLDIQGTYLLI